MGVVVIALLSTYVAVTALFFVRPATGTVRHPQAVVVLDGSGDRRGRGVALAEAGHVGTLVISDPERNPCPHDAPGVPHDLNGLPNDVRGVRVLCFDPNPVSTQGEARAIAALARRYDWQRLLVVTGTAQVTRARVRLERCYHGQMAFSGIDPSGLGGWIHDIAYEQAAIVKAEVWQRGC